MASDARSLWSPDSSSVAFAEIFCLDVLISFVESCFYEVLGWGQIVGGVSLLRA